MTEPETQPSSGGNAKYAIIGLLLFGGALGAYFLMDNEAPPAEAPPPEAPKRSTALAEPEIEIPDPVPDAGPDTGAPKPKIVYKYVNSEWACAGQLEPAAAKSVIQANSRQIRSCYERALKNNNQLQGKAVLQVRVDKGGNVAGVRVGGTLKDEQVFACMRQLANTWKFGTPTGGGCAVVQAPFDFKPQN
ncbi:MAG: AgmX/PglI C-terminal domain-containing protein [Polyangiales bacterium]|nr:AgmX/PglI C-terminal domain-containing protein [Myxococcales bacterium]